MNRIQRIIEDAYAIIAKNYVEWDAYRQFLLTASCVKCGKKYRDRPRDEDGKCLDTWLTETDCGCLKIQTGVRNAD